MGKKKYSTLEKHFKGEDLDCAKLLFSFFKYDVDKNHSYGYLGPKYENIKSFVIRNNNEYENRVDRIFASSISLGLIRQKRKGIYISNI